MTSSVATSKDSTVAVKYIKAVGLNPNFTASEKLVMMALAWHSREEGLSWPSVRTIGGWTGLAQGTVRKTLKRVESYGCVVRKPVPGTSTRYTLDLQRIIEYAPPGVESDAPAAVSKTEELTPTRTDTPIKIDTPTNNGPPPLPISIPETFIETKSKNPTPIPTADGVVVPEFYQILMTFQGFDLPLDDAFSWVVAQSPDIDKDYARDTAREMKAKLVHNPAKSRWEYHDQNGRLRSYADVWATFQTWVKRPPLNGALVAATRGSVTADHDDDPVLAKIIADKEIYERP